MAKGAESDDIATLVASRLAEPREVCPALTKMIGEDQALELGSAKVLEVNGPNCPSDFHLKPCAFHLSSSYGSIAGSWERLVWRASSSKVISNT